MDARIHIISVRLPITVRKTERGTETHFSVGGLTTGLTAFHAEQPCLWHGWPGIGLDELTEEELGRLSEQLASRHYNPVFFSSQETASFYEGLCNQTLWPLFHYFQHLAKFDPRLWEEYENGTRVFLNSIIDKIGEADLVWIHDYQLMLLPQMLRERRPNARIGFFLHIPFPSFELFRILPWREALLRGMLGADLVGFHTYEYCRHFLSCLRRIMGIENSLGQLTHDGRIVRADVFPMGIEPTLFSGPLRSSAERKEHKALQKKIGSRKMIVSVDRLDYTKGIPERLIAFDRFLEKYPLYRGNVILVMVEVPSRTGVESYQKLKRRVDELAGRINGKYGSMDWMPVWYFFQAQPQATLRALYRVAHAALITPLRDGMNLVAKEYVAASVEGKGVLILSETAGASREMSEAILVNPFDADQVADAIKMALEMPGEEQKRRLEQLMGRIRRYDVTRWVNDFISRLEYVEKVQGEMALNHLTSAARSDLIRGYYASAKRLILLDYDGTLVPFAKTPSLAFPDREIVGVLKLLSEDPANTVAVLSGRDRAFIDRHLKDVPACFGAEHGVWFKAAHQAWEETGHWPNQWKPVLRHIFDLFVDRTPGSFCEEKEYSLAWHFRVCDPELAQMRLRELKTDLVAYTANLNLSVLEGDKVLEVKNASVSKGTVARKLLSMHDYDFVLAIGDDFTDEDMFAVVPDTGHTIKVGSEPSKARFRVDSYNEARSLLVRLSRRDSPPE